MLLIAGEPIVILLRNRVTGDISPYPSGAPAIAAWVAARLGTATSFVGAVGDDVNGELIRSSLATAGVDLAAMAVRSDLPTATATVEYLPDGSRSFEFSVAGSAAVALEPDRLGDLPERATWVHVSGSAVLFGGSLAQVVGAAVRGGRAAGATVSIDPNLRAELDDPDQLAQLRQLCTEADVLFPSEGELEALGLDEDQLVARGIAVCRTMAERGARLRVGDLDRHIPAAAPAEAVLDPDGAGDTFAGAVIAGRLAGLSWPDAGTVAARIVARAITVPGPMTVPLQPNDLSVTDDGDGGRTE
jgi:sugar/nucleoside kinase (ribokinase family)